MDIEVGQGINEDKITRGYVHIAYLIKPPTGGRPYRRCVGHKEFKPLNTDWKYCPLCGEKI